MYYCNKENSIVNKKKQEVVCLSITIDGIKTAKQFVMEIVHKYASYVSYARRFFFTFFLEILQVKS